jgi:geranylgeranyl pyrophosphate synthase
MLPASNAPHKPGEKDMPATLTAGQPAQRHRDYPVDLSQALPGPSQCEVYRELVSARFRPLGAQVRIHHPTLDFSGPAYLLENGIYLPHFNGPFPEGPVALGLQSEGEFAVEDVPFYHDLTIPGLGTFLRVDESFQTHELFQRERELTAAWMDEALGASRYPWDTHAVQRGVLKILQPYLLFANDFRRASLAYILAGAVDPSDPRLTTWMAMLEYLFVGNAMLSAYLLDHRQFNGFPAPNTVFHGHLVCSAGCFLRNYAYRFIIDNSLGLAEADLLRLHHLVTLGHLSLENARGVRLGWTFAKEFRDIPAASYLHNLTVLQYGSRYRYLLEMLPILYPALRDTAEGLKRACYFAATCDGLLEEQELLERCRQDEPEALTRLAHEPSLASLGNPQPDVAAGLARLRQVYAVSRRRLNDSLAQVELPKSARALLIGYFDARLPTGEAPDPKAALEQLDWDEASCAKSVPVSLPPTAAIPATYSTTSGNAGLHFLKDMDAEFSDYYRKTIPYVMRGLNRAYPRGQSLLPYLAQSGQMSEEEMRRVQQFVFDPVQHYLDRGGKMLRSILMAIVLEAYGYDLARAESLLASIEMMEDSTIMIDDVWDDSETRRGGLSGHRLFNPTIALNAGFAIFGHSTKPIIDNDLDLSEHKQLQLFNFWTWETMQMTLAQCLELLWTLENWDDVSEAAYIQETIGRCAFLSFRGEIRIAGVVGDATQGDLDILKDYGEEVLIVYHLRGDMLDLMPEDSLWGKVAAEDITTGRRTYLIIHALQHAEPAARRRLQEILRLHTRDPQLVHEAVDIIRASGAFAQTEARIRAAADQCNALVEQLHISPEFKGLLHSFTKFCWMRKK